MAVMKPGEGRTRQSEAETIEGLFLALESPLLSYARRLVGDATAAEDLVQDAFMKLHSKFDEVRDPRAWLYRTVHNLALNQRRSANKIVQLDLSSEDRNLRASESTDTQPLPDEEIARWEGVGLVRLSLEALDDRSREVIRLKFNENLSYKEIGERTGLKSGHVGYLLHHALRTIADELARSGIVP